MTKVRVTRIICMVCRGEGLMTCYLCEGEKKVPTDRALDAAARRYRLAHGGMTSGDYPANTSRRLIADAEQIFAIAGVMPPWKQGAAA